MKISIITATYNSADHIKSCLASVQNQSYQNIEHIIIDGGSTDGTVEQLRQNNLINKLKSEPDKGIYDALNKGIQMATGDVIGFVHSDDLLAEKDVISKIVEIFEEKDPNLIASQRNSFSNEERNSFSKTKLAPPIDGVYGDLFIVDPENTKKVLRAWFSKSYNQKNVNFGWAPAHPTLFLRKEVYEKHGLFDTSFRIAGDYDFMVRIMKDSSINLFHLPKIVVKMRKGGVSTGNLKSMIHKKQEDVRVLKKHGFCCPVLVVLLKNLRKIPQLLKR